MLKISVFVSSLSNLKLQKEYFFYEKQNSAFYEGLHIHLIHFSDMIFFNVIRKCEHITCSKNFAETQHEKSTSCPTL